MRSCKPGEEQEHSSWDAVQALLSHWGSLDDDRKVTFAQMAVLARSVTGSATSTRHQRIAWGVADSPGSTKHTLFLRHSPENSQNRHSSRFTWPRLPPTQLPAGAVGATMHAGSLPTAALVQLQLVSLTSPL